MTTEIELKYLFSEGDSQSQVSSSELVARLNTLLAANNIKYQIATRNLSNTYFDTPKLALRTLDMGLRIRKADDYCEQTIKTAGRIVGGLHQRPEYNVALNIDDNNSLNALLPKLALFPDDIWPSVHHRETIEQELVPLFSTNFKRHVWHLTTEKGEIELAYDVGDIESNGKVRTINEIELELVSGEREALFDIAKLLFTHFSLISGTESKAARGYQLWHLNQSSASDDNDLLTVNTVNKKARSSVDDLDDSNQLMVKLSKSMSVHQSFLTGLEYGLSCLQKAITAAVRDTHLDNLKSVYQSIVFIKQGLNVFEQVLSESHFVSLKQMAKALIDELGWLENAQHINDLTVKSGNYRKKIEYSKQLIDTLKLERSQFPNEQAIKSLLAGEKLNQFQLALLQFILTPSFSDGEQANIALTEFAYQALENGLADLGSVRADKSNLAPLEYIVIHHHLYRSLLTGSWFGNLYGQDSRIDYRRPWLDVLQGSEELSTLMLLQQQLKSLDDAPKKLVVWLDDKIEHLVAAIQQSYQSALSVEPYWR